MAPAFYRSKEPTSDSNTGGLLLQCVQLELPFFAVCFCCLKYLASKNSCWTLYQFGFGLSGKQLFCDCMIVMGNLMSV